MNGDPRYPVGRFHPPGAIGASDRARYIEAIEACPLYLLRAIEGLSAVQLDTPYREGGWTVRQVVHHLPDSHMNAYVRFKLALTENEPVVKPYDEAAWASLNDVADTPVETSLTLLESLHKRWTILMRGLCEAGWKREYMHPETGKTMALDMVAAMYAWHSAHHVAHITELRNLLGW
jgi:hypothetical protein